LYAAIRIDPVIYFTIDRMGFTVLKIPKGSNGPGEVIAECENECDAEQFMQQARADDTTEEFDYLLERPPSVDGSAR
jgi:hypothetical protein